HGDTTSRRFRAVAGQGSHKTAQRDGTQRKVRSSGGGSAQSQRMVRGAKYRENRQGAESRARTHVFRVEIRDGSSDDQFSYFNIGSATIVRSVMVSTKHSILGLQPVRLQTFGSGSPTNRCERIPAHLDKGENHVDSPENPPPCPDHVVARSCRRQYHLRR